MSITYVTDGPWGAGTGIPKSAAVADAMIYELVQQIEAAVAGAEAPVGISSIIQDGANLTVVLTDASTQGPFPLPRPVQRPTVTLAVSGTTLTPLASQASYYFRCTNASGCTISIEDNASIVIDTEWHFRQCDGALSFTEAASTDFPVSLNPVDGKLFATDKVGAVVIVKKVAAGSFDIFGGLADDVTA